MNVTPPAAVLRLEDGRELAALPLVALRVPLWIAVGRLERLSDHRLIDHAIDINHELQRRGLDPREAIRNGNDTA